MNPANQPETPTLPFFEQFWNVRSLIALALVVFSLGLTRPASASTPVEWSADSGRREQTPLDLRVSLELPGVPYRPAAEEWLAGDLRLFRLPEAAPEELNLEFALDPTTRFVLASDLDSELPRLDSVDGETYFSVGLKLRLTPSASVFVEDFMSSAAVLGRDDAEWISRPSWDGHQVALGVLAEPHEQVALRAEVIGYLLSETRRDSGVGGSASLALQF